MKTSHLLVLILTVACSPTFSSGTADINRGLNKIERATREHAKRVQEGTLAAIQRCRALNLPTAELREKCLGEWGSTLPTQSIGQLQAAYDQIATANKTIKTISKDLP